MISKNLFRRLFFRVMAMLANCFAIAFIALSTGFYMVWINLSLILLYQVWELIRYINRTNRKMAAIIENLKSDDTTITIPPAGTNDELRDLHSSLKSLVDSINETKTRLETNNQFYKHLIEHAASGLLAIDADGRISAANAAACQLLGIGHLHNIKQIEHKDHELATIIKHPNFSHPITHQYWNGKEYRTLDLTAAQLMVRNKLLMLISLQDITNQLAQQEVQSWQKLISVLTHEIMNSIAPITSLTSAIRQRVEQKKPTTITEQDLKKTTDGLLMIEERNEALTTFITAYRQLAQLPKPQLKTIFLPDFLTSICNLMKEEFEANQISLITQIAPIDVDTDPGLLGQVIINLLINAREALAEQTDKEIHLEVITKTDNGYTISITDSGPGIDPGIADKIFVPFYTTKEKGSGIGLSLSKQIIISLGGTIRVQSHIHDFTAFILDF
ncbi:MAG: PAS domain-containing protein [Marinilabiliaceae bacterium]|nr:PAS domain-containing protein [Marinilabiliaceae bacterium]